MREINAIIVHCSATPVSWMAGSSTEAQAREIRRWHMQERGWRDIGYHFVIGRDGSMVPGRPLDRAGAHVRGHNRDTIGVCLIGGHGGTATDQFEDNFTQAQDIALREVIGNLRARFGPLPVHGHNEFAAKACPCFIVGDWL